MKFALVTLHVKDMQKSITFYNNLLEIPIVRRQPAGPDSEMVFFGKADEAQLELVPSDTNISYSGFSIGFEVDSLATIKERLASNGYNIKNEFSPVPTTTLCFLDGPNGEEVELIEYKKL
ncbi:MAG: VOC family protein [Clostridiales bacterium]|jgi:lactoylglutathione lyase|nr:VOC family protein [Clostridiales bacterium]